jgi:hypothetical protein
MEIKNPIPFSAAILSAGIIIATAVGADSFFRAKQLSNVLSVTGSAETIVTSDTVKWQSVLTRATDAAGLKTGSAQMKSDIETVKQYFKDSGVSDGEITINPVTVSPVCDSQNGMIYDRFGNQSCAGGRINGYALQQVVAIESSRVNEIAQLAQAASDYLIGRGLVFSTQSLEYYYGKLADLRLNLLTQATNDAKNRAEKIAQSTGKKIDALQAASQGVFQVTAKNSVEVSDYGIYDTASLEKKVTAVVRTSFSLK